MSLGGRALAIWRSLISSDIGTDVITNSGVPVIPATDENGIAWTRSVDGLVPPPAGGGLGTPLVVFDTPAAATAPDADTPAAGADLVNVLTTMVVTLNAVAAQAATLLVVVRDGATGAGPILWSFRIGGLLAGTSNVISIPLPVDGIRGSANTEMTVETTTAPAATNFCSIAWTGHVARA
jgi:hypothetical protein